MATTRLDTAYSAFITNVVPLLSWMYQNELTDFLKDITKRMDSEIDWAKESEIYQEVIDKNNRDKEETQIDFMDEMRSDAEEERGVIDDDDGNLIS